MNIKSESIFETIDTKEKAYWLGFLVADGFITKSNKLVRLCLSTKDEPLLNKFIQFVQGVESDKKYYGPYKTSGPQVHYSIHSEKMVNDLKVFGCVYKKSLITTFPILNSDELDLAFLLGYYDGDGTQGGTDLTSGNRSFLEFIKAKYSLKHIISTKPNSYGLSLGTALFYKMLDNYPDSLPRKRILRKYSTHKCIACENVCNLQATYCKSCFDKIPKTHTRKVKDRPPLETLLQNIKDLGYVQTGKLYGVSDNAIRKWIKWYEGTKL